MYSFFYTNTFKKDFKKCQKRSFDMSLLKTVLDILQTEGELPPKYKSHTLIGNYKNHWECHIKPDWLLIWVFNPEEKEIVLVRTGTHSDLF